MGTSSSSNHPHSVPFEQRKTACAMDFLLILLDFYSQTLKVKVYAGSWKGPACIKKERLSISAHTSQSLNKTEKKRETTETNEDPAGCQPCDPACA